jgi:hypothetical protein
MFSDYAVTIAVILAVAGIFAVYLLARYVSP